jgi:hypothetical protein
LKVRGHLLHAGSPGALEGPNDSDGMVHSTVIGNGSAEGIAAPG